MVEMQYLGDGHTLVLLEGSEKTKVSNGEIVQVPVNLVSRLTLAGFVVYDPNAPTLDEGTGDKYDAMVKAELQELFTTRAEEIKAFEGEVPKENAKVDVLRDFFRALDKVEVAPVVAEGDSSDDNI